LEYDKSEVFHFSQKKDDDNPSIDPEYALYTSESPLCPRPFWRYLGFSFDCQLSFWEHVCYYLTKAISIVYVIGILGNSLWGLFPKQKHLLYRLCVVPIVMYSFCF
ncbi:hypothetical protein AN958_05311, partial [Leucoagaricus sp. SymC.cos]